SVLITWRSVSRIFIIVGFVTSLMSPTISVLSMSGLVPLTGKASCILVMSILGGATLPVLMGSLADRIGVHHALLLPAICYLYIVYYGWRGSRPRVPA